MNYTQLTRKVAVAQKATKIPDLDWKYIAFKAAESTVWFIAQLCPLLRPLDYPKCSTSFLRGYIAGRLSASKKIGKR
jgi:hypothetical protein